MLQSVTTPLAATKSFTLDLSFDILLTINQLIKKKHTTACFKMASGGSFIGTGHTRVEFYCVFDTTLSKSVLFLFLMSNYSFKPTGI